MQPDSKLLQEYYPELVKTIKKPETQKAIADVVQESTTRQSKEGSKTNPLIQQGNKQGRAGSTMDREATTDNLDGQNIFQRDHPIQAVSLNGLKGQDVLKISTLLQKLQGGKKIFGKIIITRSPSKRIRNSL